MIINYHLVKKKIPNKLEVKFELFPVSSYKAFFLKEISIVYKW